MPDAPARDAIRSGYGRAVVSAMHPAIRMITERAPDADLARRYPRAQKYVGWPMLIVLALEA